MAYKTFTDGKFEGEGEIPGTLLPEEQDYYSSVADLLAKTLNVSKVHPVVLLDPITFERKICYLKEPNYPTKVAVYNKSLILGPAIAAEELRELSTIKESSDVITYSDSPDSDRYKLGIAEFCMSLVSRLQNQFKKK